MVAADYSGHRRRGSDAYRAPGQVDRLKEAIRFGNVSQESQFEDQCVSGLWSLGAGSPYPAMSCLAIAISSAVAGDGVWSLRQIKA